MNDLFLLREGFSKPLWRDLKKVTPQGCVFMYVFMCLLLQYAVPINYKAVRGGGGTGVHGCPARRVRQQLCPEFHAMKSACEGYSNQIVTC